MTLKLRLVPRPAISIHLVPRPSIIARVTPRLSGISSIIDDTNVTGDLGAGSMTLGWTGVLAESRGGTGETGFLQSGTGAASRSWKDKARDTVSVKDFGALGDWNGTTGTDDSAAFQAAIDAVEDAGGGDVYVPAVEKAYRLNAQIIIKPRVRLIGSSTMQMLDTSADTLDFYYGGHCLAITWGGGSSGTWGTSTGCAIWMREQTSISGLNIVYPGQEDDLTAAAPIEFPPCIAGFDYQTADGVIENLYIANAYSAIYFPATHYNLQIRNVWGGLLYRGVTINGAIQADQLTNVAFSSTNYLAGSPGAGFADANDGGLWEFAQTYAIAFDIGLADAIRFHDCGAGDCQIGIRFGSAPETDSTTGLDQYAYGSWIGGVLDGSTYNVYVAGSGGTSGINSNGFLFSGVGMAAIPYFLEGPAGGINVVMDQPTSAAISPITEVRGSLSFTGCNFWGSGSYGDNRGVLFGVLAATGGDIIFSNCIIKSSFESYIVRVLSGNPIISFVGGRIDEPAFPSGSFVHWLGDGAGAIYTKGLEIRGGSTALIGGTTYVTDHSLAAVASAATLVIPPPWGESSHQILHCSGTTGITTIDAGKQPRAITLVFTGVLTLTDGSNLSLVGNFTTGVGSTLTFLWNGSAAFEISRATP